MNKKLIAFLSILSLSISLPVIPEQRSTKIKEVTSKPRRPRKTAYRKEIFSNSPIPTYKNE
jgi:hypothetical protein